MAAALTTEEATDFATYVVLALTGWRWTWPPRAVVERYRAPGARYGSYEIPLPPGFPVRPDRDVLGPRPSIRLSGRPVIELTKVTAPDGTDLTSSVEISGGYVLTFNRNQLLSSLRGSDPEIEIEYTYGSEPPAHVARAIEVLADELVAASEDRPCRIPDRVTNISRQGMSWTVIDPQDFLDKGRTGITEVDLAITMANPGRARSRARVFSPEAPPPRRLSSEPAPTTPTP